jgi:RNA polymerase sigma factor (sigma-70 family)
MTLCQGCLTRNACTNICNSVKREIAGRGKTAALKSKTYPVDFSYIQDPHQNINEFQREILCAISEISIAVGDPIDRLSIDEAIDAGLSENEKRVVRLFMDSYKQDEIAESLGISQPRVNFLLKRALLKLKVILA